MSKYYIAVTPIDRLLTDFIPMYERFIEYAQYSMIPIAVAGVLATVIKSSRK